MLEGRMVSRTVSHRTEGRRTYMYYNRDPGYITFFSSRARASAEGPATNVPGLECLHQREVREVHCAATFSAAQAHTYRCAQVRRCSSGVGVGDGVGARVATMDTSG